MVIKKYSPTLYKSLGIYLPLITTNCAVLGVALENIIISTKWFTFSQMIVYSLGVPYWLHFGNFHLFNNS